VSVHSSPAPDVFVGLFKKRKEKKRKEKKRKEKKKKSSRMSGLLQTAKNWRFIFCCSSQQR
jgi:hypothetical protein